MNKVVSKFNESASPNDSTDYLSNMFQGDILGKLVSRVTNHNVIKTLFFAMLFQILFITLPGIIISAYSTNIDIIRIYDKRELPYTIVGFFYFIYLWNFYIWQPSGIITTFNRLDAKGVIKKTKGKNPISFLQNTFKEFLALAPFAKIIYMVFLFFLFLAVFGVLKMNTIEGVPWYKENTIYYTIVWLPINFMYFYMILWVAVRQVMMWFSLKKFFKEFEMELKIFDSDKCNGMSSIGDYSINSTWLIVAIGFWIAALIIVPLFVGQPMRILPVNILDMLGYAIFVPISLFSTSWEAHVLMVEQKRKSLKRISDEIQTLLLKKNRGDSHSNLAQVEWLEKKYSIIETNMKTWPFRPIEIRRLGFTSVTPLFSILLPIISEKIINNFFSP